MDIRTANVIYYSVISGDYFMLLYPKFYLLERSMIFCSMNNKNLETDIGVKVEDQRRRTVSH